ncbi:MAG: lipopolysaccharide biosynthesis protein [Sedimentisphaerales bacterium]|nr:lipopolysaccharide biosynthesis protein [Sedimentisphaerales bacterium]
MNEKNSCSGGCSQDKDGIQIGPPINFDEQLEVKGAFYRKVQKGGFWIILLRVAQFLFDFIRVLVLTNLLKPADFGLLAYAAITLAILGLFTQSSFDDALVKNKKDIKSYLDTAWTIGIIRALCIVIILNLFAPYTADFFEAPPLNLIIRIMSISFFLGSLSNIGLIYFTKDLEFSKTFILQMAEFFTDFLVAIVFALIYRNVWALVFGKIASIIVRVIVSYWIHPYRPSLTIDWAKAREMWKFSKWVTGSKILGYFNMEGDDFFVGKLLGGSALGLYRISFKISNLPATGISCVLSGLTFPAYALIQDDIPRLRKAYIKVLKLTSFLSFPIGALIILFAPDFVKFFMKEDWHSIIPVIQVLAIAGLCRSMGILTYPIFLISNKVKLMNIILLVRLGIIVVLIVPFSKYWGIIGVAWSVVISAIVVQIPAYYTTNKYIGYSFLEMMKHFMLPILGAGVMMVIVQVFKKSAFWDASGETSVLNGLLCFVSGLVVYAALICYVDKKMNIGIIDIVREQLEFFKSRK